MTAPGSQPVTLRDGTPALTRPITPADGAALTRGLGRLSSEGHAYRFLQYRKRFTAPELHYLTHCDFVDHIALILALLDVEGNEIDQVGVARSIRSQDDPQLAEVAIVLVDAWQHRGGGLALLTHLSQLAQASGIRRWQALSLQDNLAAPALLDRVGREIARRSPGAGTVETVHELFAPAGDPKSRLVRGTPFGH